MVNLGYCGVGMIEFLFEDGEFYFIEMNICLQVEYLVIEVIFDVDLVCQQIFVVVGQDMEFWQEDLKICGYVIEVWINVEKLLNFIFLLGKIIQYYVFGGFGVWMDLVIYDGYKILFYYDSLIGKLIVYGCDWFEVLVCLDCVLGELIVDGVDIIVLLFCVLLENFDI